MVRLVRLHSFVYFLIDKISRVYHLHNRYTAKTLQKSSLTLGSVKNRVRTRNYLL